MSFVPFTPAGWGFGPTRMKSFLQYRIPLHSLAFGEEFFLRGLCMHEHHVCITTPSYVERSAGALRPPASRRHPTWP